MILHYKEMVFNLVHALRVNPWDDEARLTLADLLEEHGRDGVNRRTTRHLREGRMVMNSLDVRASYLLGVIADLTRVQRDQNQISLIRLYMPLLTPEKYWELWRIAHRYRNYYNPKDFGDIKEEAKAVRRERLENGLRMNFWPVEAFHESPSETNND